MGGGFTTGGMADEDVDEDEDEDDDGGDDNEVGEGGVNFAIRRASWALKASASAIEIVGVVVVIAEVDVIEVVVVVVVVGWASPPSICI